MAKVIFEKSQKNRAAKSQHCNIEGLTLNIDKSLLRDSKLNLPEVSELEVVRHYTNLSQQNFSVDGNFYPLGSCTMKYNPRALNVLANLSGFTNRHPYQAEKNSQGFLQCIFELQEMLKEIVGMSGICLTPMAGAQGEFAGVSMIRAYHLSRKDFHRTEMLVPDAAHGTNPASAAMCGFKVVEIPTKVDGDIDFEVLKTKVGHQTAGIMLTNPSTLGVFERDIEKIGKLIHDVGGLLYYDGANLNAILGQVRPGEMGFDVLHLNLHKTFATPHGGGGPGCGPVACNKILEPFLPVPIVVKKNNQFFFSDEKDRPHSIRYLSAFMGNAGVMLRAYIYIRLLGQEGLKRVGRFSTLNANYLMKSLLELGYDIPFKERRTSHEFIVSLEKEAKETHVTAMDVAKRLLDFGIHSPTTYFPLLIPECLLIEPTETETKEEIDKFVTIMDTILNEAKNNPEKLLSAPNKRPLKRLDNVKAARELDLRWHEV